MGGVGGWIVEVWVVVAGIVESGEDGWGGEGRKVRVTGRVRGTGG